jgi:hypothetical protein
METISIDECFRKEENKNKGERPLNHLVNIVNLYPTRE